MMAPYLVTLRTGEVTLVPPRRRDRRAWLALRRANVEWLREWEATSPDGVPGRISYAGWVRDQKALARSGDAYTWLTHVRGELAGQVTLGPVSRGSLNAAAIGYWIGADFAGRGVTPRAVAMVADHAFFTLGLHRIEICIRPENTRSLRVVEKLGLREEGLRPSYLHVNGAWRDHRVFAANREEVGPGLTHRLTQRANRLD